LKPSHNHCDNIHDRTHKKETLKMNVDKATAQKSLMHDREEAPAEVAV
jgi:hypothetical protein